MAAKVTPTVAVQILANVAQFGSSLNKAAKDLSNFQKQVSVAGKLTGAAFGVSEIAAFTFEITKLSGEAKAVSDAFDRLPGSVMIMRDLRDVTGDTVSQFDLMKTTIKASNFGIELSKLPELLKFATLRAQQTGQSVDYLVESIIMGIGRKSPMILDNLGISLIRLREKMKGVGVESMSVAEMTKIVAEIGQEEFSKMGKFSENAATKVQRLTASWTDFKIALGDAANSTGLLGMSIDTLTTSLQILSSQDLTFLERISSFFGGGFGIPSYIDATAKMAAASVAQANQSKKAIADAKALFDTLSKSTKDYDKIRQAAQEKINQQVKVYDQAQKAANLTINDQVKKKEVVNNLTKLSSIYQNEFTKQIEASIAAAKEPPIDPEELQKQLDLAAKKWEEYFKKITKGADIVGKDVLAQEMLLVGLISKGGEKTAPLLEVPALKEDNFNLQILDSFIKKAQDAQTQSLAMRDRIVADVQSISQAFSTAAQEGLADFFMGFEQVAAKQITFGQNITNAISQFMRSFGQQIIALGVAKLGLDKLLASLTVLNPVAAFAAIAAGSALVAASGAIRAQGNLAVQRTVRTTSGSPEGTRRMESMNIQVTGNLIGSGRDLVAVISNTSYDNKIRKGG